MNSAKFGDLFGSKTTDFTVDGKCSGCGACCSNILPLSTEEVNRIAKYIQKHGIKEQKKTYASPDAMDMTCPFRDDVSRKCTIYEVRPAICRVYKCDDDAAGRKHPQIRQIQKNTTGIVLMRGTFFGNEHDRALCEMIEKTGGKHE